MWTDEDRLLALALAQLEDETCPICGHPMSECRDPKTAGTWRVLTEVCEAGRVAQALMADTRNSHGLVFKTQRTEGHG